MSTGNTTRPQGRGRSSSRSSSSRGRGRSSSSRGSTGGTQEVSIQAPDAGGEFARKRRKLMDGFREMVRKNPLKLEDTHLLLLEPVLPNDRIAVDVQLQNSHCAEEKRQEVLLEPPDFDTLLKPNPDDDDEDRDLLLAIQLHLNLMGVVDRRRYQNLLYLLTSLKNDITDLQDTLKSPVTMTSSRSTETSAYDCTAMYNSLAQYLSSKASLSSFGVLVFLSKAQKHSEEMRIASALSVAPGGVTFTTALQNMSGQPCQALQAQRKPGWKSVGAMVASLGSKQNGSVVSALTRALLKRILPENDILEFKVNDPSKVEALHGSEEAVELKSRLFFQNGHGDGTVLLLQLSAEVAKDAFAGAVHEYEQRFEEFYPDVSLIEETDLGTAVTAFEQLGVSCRFLAFLLASAHSFLGTVVAYSAEVRLASEQFRQTFSFFQMKLIQAALTKEKLDEVFPEIQHEINADPIRIPCVPAGSLTETFREYASITFAEYSKADPEGDLYALLESEWSQQHSQDDDTSETTQAEDAGADMWNRTETS